MIYSWYQAFQTLLGLSYVISFLSQLELQSVFCKLQLDVISGHNLQGTMIPSLGKEPLWAKEAKH